MAEFNHQTVLLNEAVSGLDIKPDGIYVDCTLGGGGHSGKILEALDSGHLYAFDQDQTAIDYNQTNLKEYVDKGTLTFVKANFREIKARLADLGVEHVDGILYDLGVSSPQFDVADRGFSYQHDAPLDMRMDQSAKLDAWQVVNNWSYQDLIRILFRYGEEKFAKSIARAIERHRSNKPIDTTGELVEIIKEGIPAAARRHGGHPAKKTFQALNFG